MINFDAAYDTVSGNVVYTVVVPFKMYFAIGYDCWGMDNVDMAFWSATST